VAGLGEELPSIRPEVTWVTWKSYHVLVLLSRTTRSIGDCSPVVINRDKTICKTLEWTSLRCECKDICVGNGCSAKLLFSSSIKRPQYFFHVQSEFLSEITYSSVLQSRSIFTITIFMLLVAFGLNE